MSDKHHNRSEDFIIGVLGLGHVGMPTALGFAELGWEVIGADDDHEKAARIARGDAPFYEPGLEELLEKHLRSGRFRVAPDVPTAVSQSQVLFVCVGTPLKTNGQADLSQVEAVARSIAQNLNGYKLIVEKSTTPVLTAEQFKRTITRYSNGEHECDVAVNPEFLREGTSIHDFLNPDRIVLGVESERASSLLRTIYRPLLERHRSDEGIDVINQSVAAHLSPDLDSPTQVSPGLPGRSANLVMTDLNTAELLKHAANGFLAMKISFINLVADICEATGADVTEVARGIGIDPRIGTAFLQAGLGYGGYCLPKDLQTFIRIGEDCGVDAALLKAVVQVNEGRGDRLLQKVRQALWVITGKTVGVLGLAFKPMTDDVREAPSLKVISRLLEEGAILQLHDPRAMDNVRHIFPEEPDRLRYSPNAYEAARGAHALLLLTEWEEYRTLDLEEIHRAMEVPVLIDGRNLYDPKVVRGLGFEYYSMGRR